MFMYNFTAKISLTMRKLLLTLLVLFSLSPAPAQMLNKSTIDSIVIKSIQRNIFSPAIVEPGSVGISVIEVYIQNDSIKIQSLYSSGEGYDFTNDKYLVSGLNKALMQKIPNYYKAIVPVYFHYSDGAEHKPPAIAQEEAQKKINTLKGTANVLDPVVLILYSSKH